MDDSTDDSTEDSMGHIDELDELHRNDPDLPTLFLIDLGKLQSGEANYTVDALVIALTANTTVDSLALLFANYSPSPANNARFLGPILTWIRYHTRKQLRKLVLSGENPDVFVEGMLNVVVQFMDAAAESDTMQLLALHGFAGFPVAHLVRFFRSNLNVKDLNLTKVLFVGGTDVLSTVPAAAQADATGHVNPLEAVFLSESQVRPRSLEGICKSLSGPIKLQGFDPTFWIMPSKQRRQ